MVRWPEVYDGAGRMQTASPMESEVTDEPMARITAEASHVGTTGNYGQRVAALAYMSPGMIGGEVVMG